MGLLASPPAALPPASLSLAKAALLETHGAAQRARIERGVDQAASLWRASDGDPAAFVSFAKENFASDPQVLEGLLLRFEENLESLDGHMLEIGRDLSRRTVIEMGPILPVDRLFGAWEPAAHVGEDLFAQKIAFVALLNFPLSTLEERLEKGGAWTRRQWAESRLARRFETRVPADVSQGIAQAAADAELYIARYNVWMHHVVDAKGTRLWPKGLKLLSHWNLRDEIKANYATKDGLPKQRLVAKVMDRIVTQTIPAAVVDNPTVDWDPVTNVVTAAPSAEVETGGRPKPASGEREPDTRYARLLACYRAARAADPYSPTEPTLMSRRFDVDREIAEQRVESLFTQILSSPLIPRIASVIQKRLGRRLEPFDVWYDGFRPRAEHAEAELDALTRAKYPTAEAYKADLPRLFEGLGFTRDKARWLAGTDRRRPLARLRARARRPDERRLPAPAYARRAGRHGLQGLQHRRPRDGPQRRAALLALRGGPLAPRGRPEQRVHGGARVRLPGPRPRAPRPEGPRRRRPDAQGAERALADVGDRGVRRSST